MTKAELAAAISRESGLTWEDSEKALNAMLNAITKELEKGGKVRLTRFGAFEIRERAGRQGKNPQTGAPMIIAAFKTPVFKASRTLKNIVR
jgi:nucleoid DNA-binding protein